MYHLDGSVPVSFAGCPYECTETVQVLTCTRQRDIPSGIALTSLNETKYDTRVVTYLARCCALTDAPQRVVASFIIRIRRQRVSRLRDHDCKPVYASHQNAPGLAVVADKPLFHRSSQHEVASKINRVQCPLWQLVK